MSNKQLTSKLRAALACVRFDKEAIKLAKQKLRRQEKLLRDDVRYARKLKAKLEAIIKGK